MAEISLVRIPYGWRAVLGEVTLDAESPHFDRGAIRATLTIRDGHNKIYVRDTVNLTSSRIRQKILQKLAEKSLALEESVLIALDEACRTARPRSGDRQENVRRDGGGDFSEKVTSFRALQGIATSFLLLKDPDVLPVNLGAIQAHTLGGNPVWIINVAPPSGTKTEIIRAMYGLPKVYPLSELTARTFASGLDTHGGDPSLLSELTDEVLALKDFTTILEMPHDERQAILAQLREIFDGRLDRRWGTGKSLNWKGRLGFIAGVTPVIDNYHEVLSILGERFVMLRIRQPSREELARKAVKDPEHDDDRRGELAAAVRSFMNQLQSIPPEISFECREAIAQLANFVSCCRSGVVRDGYKRELNYAPEAEMPARLAKQLFELLRGVSLVMGHTAATQEDLDRVGRVALDCIPSVRRVVLREVAKLSPGGETFKVTQVAGGAQYSSTTVRRALEDLQALGILTVKKFGQGIPDQWAVQKEWLPSFCTMKKVEEAFEQRIQDTFPEKSEDPSRQHISACEVCGSENLEIMNNKQVCLDCLKRHA
jgi:hypothetical protein